MTGPKYLKGECQHCHGHLEFPVESTGLTADCPHCGQVTELMLPLPPLESSVPRRWLVMTAIAIAILVSGLVTCVVLLKHFEHRLARLKAKTAASASQTPESAPTAGALGQPATNAGFQVSAVALEKTPGSSLVYAVGSLKNTANRQRFGVRLEFDLLDGQGQKVGTAKDYQPVLEPGAEWRFKALVVSGKAVSAKVASIQEDQ
jgi:hypothetical protein